MSTPRDLHNPKDLEVTVRYLEKTDEFLAEVGPHHSVLGSCGVGRTRAQAVVYLEKEIRTVAAANV